MAKIALSLSGGGFRAALFHLGVLKRLHELDLLKRVALISAVSGGAVTAALFHLYVREYELVSTSPDGRKDFDLVYIWDEFEQYMLRIVNNGILTYYNPSLICRIAVVIFLGLLFYDGAVTWSAVFLGVSKLGPLSEFCL